MNPPSQKRLLKKISLTLLAPLVIVLILELVLRIFLPAYYPIIPAAYEYDQELAFQVRPAAHLFKTTDFQQESQSNSLGTANFQERFDDYESLVFTLGDSFTQGIGVPADMSYPFQLDLMLNQDEQGYYVKKFGVVNLGVAGFGGEQELIGLQRWTTRIGRPPSVILYLGCDNDFKDDLMFKNGDRHKTVIAGSPVWGRATTPLRLLLENSQIALISRAVWLDHRQRQLANDALKGMDQRPTVAELELSVIERLRSFAKAHNSVLIMSWSEETSSYLWLKLWATQNGVAFADWAPRARSVIAAIPPLPRDNQHSARHHRGWTNQVIAAEFVRQIRTQLSLQRQ